MLGTRSAASSCFPAACASRTTGGPAEGRARHFNRGDHSENRPIPGQGPSRTKYFRQRDVHLAGGGAPSPTATSASRDARVVPRHRGAPGLQTGAARGLPTSEVHTQPTPAATTTQGRRIGGGIQRPPTIPTSTSGGCGGRTAATASGGSTTERAGCGSHSSFRGAAGKTYGPRPWDEGRSPRWLEGPPGATARRGDRLIASPQMSERGTSSPANFSSFWESPASAGIAEIDHGSAGGWPADGRPKNSYQRGQETPNRRGRADGLGQGGTATAILAGPGSGASRSCGSSSTTCSIRGWPPPPK